MALKEIQNEVDSWIKQYKIGYFKPMEIITCLTEELGELAKEINHEFGPKKKKHVKEGSEIGAEIADIIMALCCLANSLDIDLDEEFKKSMKKVYTRDNDRWEKK